MNVGELIEKLKMFPADMQVQIFRIENEEWENPVAIEQAYDCENEEDVVVIR